MISGYQFNIDSFPPSSNLALIIAFIVNNGPRRINLSNFFITMWQLWKARNDLKFQGSFKEPSQICFMAEAMASSFSKVISQFDLQAQDQQAQDQQENHKKRMDIIPSGIRCYIDASWNNGQAGIGIFIHDPSNHNAIFVQAITDKAQSALQAELLALQLSLEISLCLRFTGVIYLMDNETIAEVAKRRNFLEEPGHWSLRPFWSQIISLSSN